MSNRAWVTLATNDSYGLGALVLAHSLRKVGSVNPAVILITPSVTEAMRNRLSAVFAEVISVDVLDSKDEAHLALLQRPELGITFTKIHCWNLTQYEKCVFLDADTLIVQNCDELFEREEFSAAPDVGWPDCFNSGVFVFKPSKDTFGKLIKFAQERGSFDGGDQGLLNSFFSDWAHGDISKHLPFLYNVTSAAFYSYLPALKHYGQNLKIIHFIGAAKPWLQQYNWESHSVNAPDHLREFLQLWWDIFVGQVHSILEISMVDDESGTEVEDDPESEHLNTVHYAPEVNPDSEFPWHHPGETDEETSNDQQLDLTQFYDPWEHHRGNIPGHVDTFNYQDNENMQNQNRPVYEEPQISNFIWSNENNWNSEQYQDNDNRQWNNTEYHYNHSHHHNWQEQHQNNSHHHSHQQPSYNHHIQKVISEQSSKNEQEHFRDNKHFFDSTQNQNFSQSSRHTDLTNQDKFYDFTHINTNHYHTLPHKSSIKVVKVYHVHMDHQRIRKRYSRRTIARTNNGDISDTESEGYDDFIPRHPYDGFYLRHRTTIDPRGHKVCTHEVPIAPSPTPIDSPLFTDPEELENGVLSDNIIDDDHTGVAGNLAKVKPGASGIQRDALDELSRRQGWEAGNIDYMGADSFDNIWSKISQTLSGPPKEPTPPPKEPTPPPKEPAPPLKEPTPPPKEPTPPPKEPTPPPKEQTPIPKEPTPPPKEATPTKESVPVVEESTLTVSEPAPAPKEPTPPVKEPTPPPKELIEILDQATLSEEPNQEVLQQALDSAVEKEPLIPSPVAEAFAEVLKEAAEVSALVKECLEKEKGDVPPTPPATPKSTPEPSTPVTETVPSVVASTQNIKPELATAEIPSSPVGTEAAISLTTETTPVKSADLTSSDSPPLANTPSTESPAVPAAKSEERRKPASKLLLPTVGAGDALPTPDSEFEDAATLAQSIIASELATPTVSSSSPVAQSPPAQPRQPTQLAPADPEVPTPPVGATVSLAQIGVKPSKVSCAEQIASSLTEQEPAKPTSTSEPSTPTDAPKKKVTKKAAKKEGDAPVPPPRKKEKKPKDK